MIFKRQEGFRYVFGEPLEAGVVVLIDGKPLDIERKRITCEVLDISPRGLKMAIDEDFNEYKNKVLKLEISFMLDSIEIKCIGEIVWSKKFGSGYHYGIIFFNQSNVEELIINELKARRRKEVLQTKIKID